MFRDQEPEGDYKSLMDSSLTPIEMRIRTNPRARAAFEEERKKGYDEGYALGQKEGTDEALRIGLAEQRDALAKCTGDFAEMHRRIQQAVEQYWLTAEEGLRQLAVDIAQKLLKQELQQNPEAILAIVREALIRVANTHDVRVRVCTSDLPALRSHQADLLAAVEGISRIEWMASADMIPGGCVVESSTGVVDATLPSQVENINVAMRKEAA